LWRGWIEFTDGLSTLRASHESEQPNRDDLMYWAQGLTHVYLEGALERALHATVETTLGTVPLSIEPNVRPIAVIDPYVVFGQGEQILRGQLHALSHDQLNAVIGQYDLGAPVPAVPRGPTGYVDAVERIITRIKATTLRTRTGREPGAEAR
jgi:hypothetical protein